MMDEGEEEKTGHSNPGPHIQPLCRFFSQGRHCNYGKRCRFLHIRDDANAKSIKNPKPPHVTSTTSEVDEGNVEQKPNPADSSGVAPAAVHRPCRYFLSGHCTMEDRCRFWHPSQLPSLDDHDGGGNNTRPIQRRAVVPRPSNLREVKLCELTEDVAKKLRDTEIEQLKKRFLREQLIIQEQNGLAYYRVPVEATDPDWVKQFYLLYFNQS